MGRMRGEEGRFNQRKIKFAAESKGKITLTFAAMAACPIIMTATFMGLYWSLVSKADDFNEWTGIDGAFDQCRVGGKM